MPSITKSLSLLAIALFANGALGSRFAQFCNDDNCSEGCGASVEVDNPGCLTQFGRRSIKFHGDNFQDISLIASPGETCDCQNYCEESIVQSVIHFNNYNPECFTLRDEEAQSFRFILGDCPADQC